MQKINTKLNRGFTLIEMLLYISIAGTLMLVISIFTNSILESSVKNTTIIEVESSGEYISQIMNQTLRNATSINTPIAGNTSSTLSVDTTDAVLNPTIFDLSGGVLRIKEGTADYIELSNSKVIVSDLNFKNLTVSGAPASVSYSFTVSSSSVSPRQENKYSQNFYGGVSLRK